MAFYLLTESFLLTDLFNTYGAPTVDQALSQTGAQKEGGKTKLKSQGTPRLRQEPDRGAQRSERHTQRTLSSWGQVTHTSFLPHCWFLGVVTTTQATPTGAIY